MITLSTLRRTVAALFVVFLGTFSVFAVTAKAADKEKTETRSGPASNIGEPTATNTVKDSKGNVAQYGSDAIIYKSPSTLTGKSPAELRSIGRALYMQNCSSCHGIKADGILAEGNPEAYPNLIDLGPAVIDFWISSGRMPAADPNAIQAARKPARLSSLQSLAIAEWVNSLSNAYPYVPVVNTDDANRAEGLNLFALNCAACHTITGGGDALAFGTYAPTLQDSDITATQIATAIRSGPGNMPNYSSSLTDEQVADIVKYVKVDIQNPTNIGGAGFGGLGPVAEGFIALSLGIGILALAAFWVGDRQ
jgi:ubiquinol-cytochrome c reductase cytochrome c subunit